MVTTSPESDFSQHPLAALPTVQAWSDALPQGQLPSDGSFAVLDVTGLSGIRQRYGLEAADQVVLEIVARVQRALPFGSEVIRGDGNLFFVWFPAAHETLAHDFTIHLRQVVCATPVVLSDAASILPQLAMATLEVRAHTAVAEAIWAAERALSRRSEETEAPGQASRLVSPRDELDQRLDALDLYGRDEVIEEILAHLSLPALEARTVLVLGPPQASKTRVLSSLAQLLGNQRLPLVEASCRPGDQHLSCGLLSAVIFHLMQSCAQDDLIQRFAPLLTTAPWLARLFPVFGDQSSSPPPPDDREALRRVLQTMLVELAGATPLIAVIHGLHCADTESLNTFAAIQAMTGHGLRIIAGVDQESDGTTPATIPAPLAAQAFPVTLEPLSREQVCAYLQEVAPDVSWNELADPLYAETGGLPLTLATTLRSWAHTGALEYQGRHWAYHAERAGASKDETCSAEDFRRLRIAAMVCPTSFDALCTLWKTTPEEALRTISSGRGLGYLRPIDFHHPEQVEMIDQEHANALIAGMDVEERATLHAEIGARLAETHAHDVDRYAHYLIYHFLQAGQRERANAYLGHLQLATSTLTPMLMAPQAGPFGGVESWDIPPARPVTTADVEKIVTAALAIRLAGVQYRLYPPNSDMARAAMQEAMAALEDLFLSRPSFIITFDGRTVAFDGQIIQRRDLQVAIKDYLQWMSEGNIRAIGISYAVREYELARFLHALATYEPREAKTSLLDRFLLLNLTHIKLLTRSVQADLLLTQPSSAGTPPATGHNLPFESPAAPSPTDAGLPEYCPPVAAPPVIDQLADASERAAPQMAEPEQLDERLWHRLPEIIRETSQPARRLMMNNLARWLDDDDNVSTPTLTQKIDQLLADRLTDEEDQQVLQETLAAIEARLQRLLNARDWKTMLQLLQPFYARLRQELSSDVRQQLRSVLARIGEGIAQCLQPSLMENPQELEQMRKVIDLLGEHVMHPLIAVLKSATVMQERSRILQLLREFGAGQQGVLCAELRAANPWYVYRNLLNVLSEIGTEEALTAIGEKMTHDDPRVRMEAVGAALRIARGRGVSYLVQGLNDPDATVRGRAVALVSLCPEPRVLELVIQMLQPNLGRDEPDSVQLTACLALGHFEQDLARMVLLQILHPSLLSPYRRKGDMIRSAAVTALGQHLPHPAVEAALKRASSDRSAAVRQAVQRAWQQHAARRASEPTA